MRDEFTQRVCRQHSFYGDLRKFHCKLPFHDALAQLVIISQIVDQRLEAADCLQVTTAERQRGPKTKAETALYPTGTQHGGAEINDAERFNT